MKTKKFKGLIVWQKTYRSVLEVYKITKDFPKYGTYGLAQQMRRRAISLPSNIAEGYGRRHRAEYKQFLSIANGSSSELETQYLSSIDLGYTEKSEVIENLLKEVGSILYVV